MLPRKKKKFWFATGSVLKNIPLLLKILFELALAACYNKENGASMLSYFHMRNAFGDEDEVSELSCSLPVRLPLYSDHPEQCRAYDKVNHAIKTGRLVPQPCEVCTIDNQQNVVAHHQDYSKPLDVNWLCASCHKRISDAVRELVLIAKGLLA